MEGKEGLTRRAVLALGGALAAARALRIDLVEPAAAATPRSVTFAMDVPASALGARSGLRAGAARTSWIATPPLRAPKRFDLLGLSWRKPASARVEVRVRRPNGRWSGWVPVPTAGDHGPDSGKERGTTDPVWAGGCDQLQLRLSTRVEGLRVHFVNSSGTATPAARLATAAAMASRPAAKAQVPAGPPAIIPRSAWADARCKPRTGPSYGQVQAAFVHHTVNANDYRPEESAAIVRAICVYHRDTNGWNDIGYNFLVDKYGQIFEGRAGGIDRAVIGAQAQGFNGSTTGVANIGDFMRTPQSDAALRAVARLIAWKLTLHGAPVSGPVPLVSQGGPSNRWKAGTRVTLDRINGHRDGCKTDCPGDVLYRQLPRIRELAAQYAARGSTPLLSITVPPAAVPYGDPVELFGQLTTPDGAPLAGAPIAVQARGSSDFVTVANAVTREDGTWSATLPGTRDRVLRAVFAGDDANPAAASAAVTAGISPVVEIAADQKRIRAGELARVTGRVLPRVSHVRLRIERQGKGRAFFPFAERRLATKAGGVFAARQRISRPGLYRIRLTARGREAVVHVRVLRG